MNVPLVQRRPFAYPATPYLSQNSPLYGFSRTSTLGQASLNFADYGSDDAVKITLRGRTGSSNENPTVEELKENLEQEPRSYLDRLFSEIGAITDRIGAIQNRLATEALGADQRTALNEELNSLYTNYNRLLEGPGFEQFLEISRGIQSNLMNGTSGSDMYRSLLSHRSLLGDDFLSLVAGGSLSGVQSITRSLETIRSITGDVLRSDPTLISTLEQAIKSAKAALSSGKLPTLQTAESSNQTETQLLTAPSLNTVQFAIGDNLALSLRGYTGRDLLAVAVSGYQDAEFASQLILEAPKKDKEDEEEEAERKREELKLPPLAVKNEPEPGEI